MGTIMKSSTLVRDKEHAPEKFYGDIYENWRLIYGQRHGVGATGRAYFERKGSVVLVDEYKSFVETKAGKSVPEWPDNRQHLASMRKAIDNLLAHIWMVWRDAEGWPVRGMYVHEVLEHKNIVLPDGYSSPALARRKDKSLGFITEE
jgi:hypothetical protein